MLFLVDCVREYIVEFRGEDERTSETMARRIDSNVNYGREVIETDVSGSTRSWGRGSGSSDCRSRSRIGLICRHDPTHHHRIPHSLLLFLLLHPVPFSASFFFRCRIRYRHITIRLHLHHVFPQLASRCGLHANLSIPSTTTQSRRHKRTRSISIRRSGDQERGRRSGVLSVNNDANDCREGSEPWYECTK